MSLKDKKILVSTVLIGSMLIISLGGYKIFKKEEIHLTVKGDKIELSTFKYTVKDLLKENKIEYDEDDKINPPLETELKDAMDIQVVEVVKSQEIEYEDLQFEVKLIEDNTLEKGKSKVENEGELGKKELTYDTAYEDGKLVEKTLVNEVVYTSPKDKVVKKGTKEEIIVASRGNTSRNKISGQKQIQVVATAYAGDTITSTGTVPKWGTIAVDPRVIPYGTKVYIPQFDMTFKAEDCGGAIKGNKIDIFMGSESQAYGWGRRTIDVYIVK
ncbi:MAG: G5 domain-containing protein [Romboutsia sp.]